MTFTILSGGNPVGSPVSGNVSGDVANATYTLLAKTPGGSYTIQAVYTDPINFTTSTGTNTLTVAAAATTVIPSSASGTFNSTAGEGISLAADVNSTAGTVTAGSVTFDVLDASSNLVAQDVVSVANGIASGNYLLPAGTAVGTYTIKAVYNGTPSFATSLPATSTLSIGAATTTTTASDATVSYNSAGETANLTASVISPGGTVHGGSVTFTILNGSTTIGTAQTVTVSKGTAGVSYALSGTTGIGTYTIQAVYTATTDFGGSSDNTHSLTVTEPPAAKLFIQTEPPSTATAGQAFATVAQPVAVYEEDQFGDLESGDNSTVVTVNLGSGNGPLTGTFTATVVGGIATFTNLGDDTAETITLTFSSGNLATATSSSIIVSPAAGSKLIVAQQPSPNATAGQVFGTQPIVEEVDQYGNVISDSTDTVTAVRGDVGTSTLLGDKLTVTLADGVATFAGLSYNRAESMDITFTDSATGVSPVTSNPVLVAPTTPSQLVISQQPSTTATVGQPFPTQPVVYEEDQFGNLETGDNSTQVTALLASGSGPLQGTAAVTLSGGVARYSGLYDNKAETIKLDFSAGTFLSAPSNSIVVGPSGASKLVIAPGLSTTATAGQPFAVQPVVYVEDASGNIETGDNTTQVTVSLASGAGTLLGTTTVTVKGGIATFTGLADKVGGTISLAFSATDGLTAGPSNNILITPDVANKLVISTQPSAKATVGQPFLTQPVVEEEDQYGNIETGDSSTVITAALDSGAGPLLGTTTKTLQDGVAAFAGLFDKTAETITLGFTGGGLTSLPSSSIVVSPGAAVSLVIQTQPYPNVTAGSPLTDPIVVDEVDQYGNIVKGDNSTQVTASLASGSGTLIGTSTVTVQDGVASFNDLEDDTAGTLTLQFNAGTLPPVVSNPSTVAPGPASSLAVVKRPPGGIPAGSRFEVGVNAYDRFGNLATSFNGPVTVGLASGSAGTLNGTLTVNASAGQADFTDLSDTVSGNISLDATSGSLSTGSSGDATVTLDPDVPAMLVIQSQPSQTATAGVAFVTTSQSVVVYEEDQYGNLETGDSSTVVTAFLASGAGPLQGTLTATVADGVATFTNLYDDTAETITLEFTGGGFTSAASVPLVVSPAAASQLVLSQPPSATATAGAALPTQPVLVEKDKYGNVETGDSTTTVTAALASGAGPLQGTTSIVLKGGVATFTNLYDKAAETITLSFSGGGLKAGPTGSIVVSPAAAAKLVIQSQPSQTATAGQAFKTQPVIDEEDQYGNILTGDSTTTVTALVASGTGTLAGDRATRLDVLARTAEAMAPDGFLVLGENEAPGKKIVQRVCRGPWIYAKGRSLLASARTANSLVL